MEIKKQIVTEEIKKILTKYSSSNNIKDKLDEFYSITLEWNDKLNLTRITNYDDFYLKHFYDSAEILNYFNFSNKRLLDFGSGAGFPGIVLKIIQPTSIITLVESSVKRCDFLNYVIKKMKLKNINVINSRVEDFSELEEGKYDYILSRAVAKINILLEISSKLLKINGLWISYKGKNYQEELSQADNAAKILNMILIKIIKYGKGFNLEHNYIIFNKEGRTPKKYPRKFSNIKKKPL